MLDNTQLSGEISSELGNLKSLKPLGLSAGNFSGRIPSELGLLKTMVYLALNLQKLEIWKD